MNPVGSLRFSKVFTIIKVIVLHTSGMASISVDVLAINILTGRRGFHHARPSGVKY